MTISGCDLQPKIVSLPDSVGDFISTRYPALLADPDTQPEIYNSAATDYGMYASPELYGTDSTYDDYVLYASINDYIVPPQTYDMSVVYGSNTNRAPMTAIKSAMPEQPEMTPIVISETMAPDADVKEVSENDYLMIPSRPSVITDNKPTTITVARGDTVYSLARKYGMTTEQFASINNIKPPYALRVGQTLKLQSDIVKKESVKTPSAVVTGAVEKTNKTQNIQKDVVVTVQKTTSPVVNKKTKMVQTTTRVNLREITVEPGDTLYSLSRKYSVPVNDLAVMNKLSMPFTLSVGQKLKVPDLQSAPVMGQGTTQKTSIMSVSKTDKVQSTKTTSSTVSKQENKTTSQSSKTKSDVKKQTTQKTTNAKNTTSKVEVKNTGTTKTNTVKTEQKKISSDPNTKLPQITARSSSKFSWPVRGTILSNYGAKSGGLFNDGINIGANRGTIVRAAENGVVAYAGNEVKGMGNLIIIQHTAGWMTVYAHLDSMYVRRGSRVSVGGQIGTVGQTGKVEKPQLHFEIRKGTKAYNPTSYLKK